MMSDCCTNWPRASNNHIVFVHKLTHITSSNKSDCPLAIATYSLIIGMVPPITVIHSFISIRVFTILRQQETLNSIVIGRPQTSVIQLEPWHLPSNTTTIITTNSWPVTITLEQWQLHSSRTTTTTTNWWRAMTTLEQLLGLLHLRVHQKNENFQNDLSGF